MISNVTPAGGIGTSGPTILVVEDDVLVRASVAQYLRSSGFHVLEAVDVPEAVSHLRANESIRVAFCDVKLPGSQSGLDLVAVIQRDFPRVAVLLTSGVVQADLLAQRDIPFLRKPYFLFEIEHRIKTLLLPI